MPKSTEYLIFARIEHIGKVGTSKSLPEGSKE